MAIAPTTLPDDPSESPVRELVRRFLITLLLGVVVYRLGVFIPIPGVDASVLKAKVSGTGDGSVLTLIIAFADMFNGGAIMNASIFGLGITPYISASIILQLLTFSMPALKAIQKEGESGRRKINQYTRYATLAICSVQSVLAAIALTNISHEGRVLVTMENHALFVAQAALVITTGSMVILWIAEQITKFGIGNGVSVVIMISILSSLPAAFHGGGDAGLPYYLGLALVSMTIIAGIVVVVQAVRRIGLEQQRRVQGNKVYGGAQTSLPLKLNQANVIPVIFAQPVMMALGLVAGWALSNWGLGHLFDWGTPLYRYCFAALIVGFTFFYISITFDLYDLSNHFKQAGFFIRGIKPGKNTVDYLAFHLKRITFMGAAFLAIIAILPEFLESQFGLAGRGGRMLMGGTGLLIVVGVSLDVMQKVGAFFLAHQYRGLGGIGDANANAKKSGKRF
ncbi:MAG TPA: preprotein translocase subunit SecY [Planctomycetota bacterium]|nr:preprotein translocase subunit SecY [Planctomycetota bacterium]